MVRAKPKQVDQREQFITEFIRRVLIHTKIETVPLSRVVEKALIEGLSPSPFKTSDSGVNPAPIPEVKPIVQLPKPSQNQASLPKPVQIPRPVYRLPARNSRPVINPLMPKTGPLLREIPQQKQLMQPQIPSPSPAPSTLNLGKLDAILKDASVTSIECPGPDKPLVISKGRFPQTLNLVLSSDEITQIMTEISKVTKIPLMGGVFKAAIADLLVTALISDFVGTRFVLQRLP